MILTQPVQPWKINMLIKILSGFTSGFLSAALGIGGGIINTPILKMFGYPINVAIGCSATFGFLISWKREQ